MGHVGTFTYGKRRGSDPRRTLAELEDWKPSGVVTRIYVRESTKPSGDVKIKVSLPRVLWLERPDP